ncbi:MAG: putative ubiquitin-RnfH superfamily antitoxin RatB of RatAB toxin-antitoxin module [Gammaproteobacteria bacterium]|jgi:putative ubiquitin-RnfH superfamily antitoxin RatB of RatAB toxin-antitoxin module
MATDNAALIAIEVAYATPLQSWLIPLNVEAGTTIAQAITSSGILEQCPEIDLQINKVGIFSIIAELDTLLRAGDRIEIYRPLILDPKEARRLRAQKTKQKK